MSAQTGQKMLKNTWKIPVNILLNIKTTKQSVNVNIISENMFKIKQPTNKVFGLQFWSKTEANADPIVYPKYSTLPSVPNLELLRDKSLLILLVPAGRIP